MSTLPMALLSISASNDELSTTETINASKNLLHKDTNFTATEGGVHANFGDYVPQSSDDTPTMSRDDARTGISRGSFAFVESVSK